MNIAEAKRQIEDAVEEYLARDETGAYLIAPEAQRPLFLLGAPGIGKTAVVGQVASELGIGLVSYSMTHHTRQSALGLPFIVHKCYGDEEFEVSEYTMSEIIASIYDYREETGCERGILFLDEINCVSETLYPSMLQFLQFKTFGRHRIPDGWIVVCAGNPPEYNRSVYDFDVVTLDRLRKIAVEPDLGAWRAYALKTSVHPAVLSYLEVKPDHFYSVESTPDGKSFVTARGWDDLSRIIKLHELKGKPVDRSLVDQFLQDDSIAERFAQYYLLFTKYRSDYQIASILAGYAPDKIKERAQAARFDERLALARLVLDALDAHAGAVAETEQVVRVVRDALREEKPAIVNGEPARDALERAAHALNQKATHDEKAGVPAKRLRSRRLGATWLSEFASACDVERAPFGETAFAAIERAYSARVQDMREQSEACAREVECAFGFIEEVFGNGREMVAFAAEFAAREGTSQFASRFGGGAYAKHGRGVLAAGEQSDLEKRLQALDLDALADADKEARRAEASKKPCGCGSCGGC